jgi:hypothetical protein
MERAPISTAEARMERAPISTIFRGARSVRR